jgi:beta-mannosidase
VRKIDLNGTWKLRWSDGQRGGTVRRFEAPLEDLSRDLDAVVPGAVHLDLLRAGIIAEPSEGMNVLACRWVEEMVWYYRRSFAAPPMEPNEKAFLVFDCLDLSAIIRLNGVEIGRHANAFRPCCFEVTGRLRAGENILVVEVEAGLISVSERPSLGFGIEGPDDRAWDHRLHKRHWLRKTQSSFAWDWSPRLINVGITGNVQLEICHTVRVVSCSAVASLSADHSTGTVEARVFVESLDDTLRRGVLQIGIDGTAVRSGVEVNIPAKGLYRADCSVCLPAPRLWWPAGHGDQPLYTVWMRLEVDGNLVAQERRNVAFRRIVVDQSAHPVEGRWFRFEINAKPIFVKGANFVPADTVLPRVDHARYAQLVDRAREANFNMLRVWGGGLYEAADFYDLCDRQGMLVWQEFIFACAKYPAHDAAFLEDVAAEARHQVRRLSHHPSLIAWCGNNEMEEAAYHWGYERGVAYPDYALFHLVLPRIVQEEDGTRYYQPSSPYSPDHQSPQAWHVGDQHPWSVGFQNTDFRDYRQMSCRFPNEGGILGPTALPTVRVCLPKGQDVPGSFAWRLHDNGVQFWGNGRPYPDLMLEQWLGRPITDMSIEDWVYWGGVVQGEGLGEYIRNFRRRMFDSASAIFWMFNDVWPAVRSWTIVDYYLRRTPAFWPVRRAFRPLIPVIAVEDGRVRVFGVNEGPAWRGELRYGIFSLAGEYPINERVHVELPANASTSIVELDLAEWHRLGETRHAAFALLLENGEEITRDRMFLPLFKEMEWPAAEVHVSRLNGKAIFESSSFAWRVCLDLDGERMLPDNFFDVFPGIPTVLDWPEELGEPRILRIANST